MKKYTFLYLILLLANQIHTQCVNPETRFERLKSRNFTRDSIAIKYKNELDFLNLMPHDTIADVGSYDGYYPSIYAIFTDSISFYLNDITYEGFKNFKALKALCEAKRSQNQTNSFKIIIGNAESTNLPDRFFNKIILRDVLHHCENMSKILEDVKRLMKKETSLFLFEPLKLGNEMDENLCARTMTRDTFLELMNAHNFILNKEMALDENHSWFMFKQKE
jgi:2-polyprenyl-3-methyl-5-hydroxy-6-metoxy-1,4-benzoquinol methylase